MPVDQINDWGKIAGSISAIIALTALIFGPIKRRVLARKTARDEARKAETDFRAQMRHGLDEINGKLAALSDDIGDLQYERLAQAQEFYAARGWCTGAKKQMLIKMHESYRKKGRNHLSEHYEEEILNLADKPPEGEKS